MEDIIVFLLTIFMGFFAYFSFKLASEEVNRYNDDQDDHVTIYAISEKVNGSYCLYNAKTNAFLVQVKTVQDIQDYIDRFKDRTRLIIKGEIPTNQDINSSI